MKIWKLSIVGCILLALTGLATTAAVVTDGTGDVYHYSVMNGVYSWQIYTGEKPNVDITDISYTIDGDNITITLTIAGEIQSSENIAYWVYLNTTDSTYWMSWANGTGGGMAMGADIMNGTYDFEPEITADGATLTGVFTVVGDTTDVEFWAYAAEYSEYGNVNAEWWGDWAPDSTFTGELSNGTTEPPADNTTDDPSSTGTPGFELVVLIGAVAVALVLLRKKK